MAAAQQVTEIIVRADGAIAATNAYATATTRAEQAVDKFTAAQARRQQADYAVAQSTSQATAQLNLYIRNLDPLLTMSQQLAGQQGLLVGALGTAIAKWAESATSIDTFVQASGKLVASLQNVAASVEKANGFDPLNMALEKFAEKSLEAAASHEKIANAASKAGTAVVNFGESLIGLAAGANPAGAAVALTAVAVVGLAVAVEKAAESERNFNLALRASGGAASMTAAQLGELAENTAGYGGVTIAAAEQMAAAYVRSGKIGGGVLQDLMGITADFAALSATDLAAATGKLAQVFADPARGALELDRAYNILSAAQLRDIRNLTEQGRLTEAQAQLLDALKSRAKGAAEEGLGPLTRMWKLLERAADVGGNAIVTAGNRLLDPKFGQTRADLQQRETSWWSSPSASRAASIELSDELEAQRGRAWSAQAAASRELEKQAVATTESLDPLITRTRQLANQEELLAQAQAKGVGDYHANADAIEKLRNARTTLLTPTQNLLELARIEGEVLAAPIAQRDELRARLMAEHGLRGQLRNDTERDIEIETAAMRVIQAKAAAFNDAAEAAKRQSKVSLGFAQESAAAAGDSAAQVGVAIQQRIYQTILSTSSAHGDKASEMAEKYRTTKVVDEKFKDTAANIRQEELLRFSTALVETQIQLDREAKGLERVAQASALGAAAMATAERQHRAFQEAIKAGKEGSDAFNMVYDQTLKSLTRQDVAKATADWNRYVSEETLAIESADRLADARLLGAEAVAKANIENEVAKKIASATVSLTDEQIKQAYALAEAKQKAAGRDQANAALVQRRQDLSIVQAEQLIALEDDPGKKAAMGLTLQHKRDEYEIRARIGQLGEEAVQKELALADASARTRQETEQINAIKAKGRELTDGLFNMIEQAGTKGGRSFFQSFTDWGLSAIKTLAKEMVFRPLIQPILTNIVGAIPQIFGLAAPGAAAGNGGPMGMAQNAGVSWLSKLMPSPTNFLPADFLNPFNSASFFNMADLANLYPFLSPISSAGFAVPGSAVASEAAALGIGETVTGGYGAAPMLASSSGTVGGAGSSMFGAAGAAGPLAVAAAAIIALWYSGALEDEDTPRGNAQILVKDGRLIDGDATTLDGYDITPLLGQRDSVKTIVNGLIDGLSLKLDDEAYGKGYGQWGGLGGIGTQFGWAQNAEEYVLRMFAWNTNANRTSGDNDTNLSEGVYQLEAGIGTRAAGNNDEGWRTIYVDEKTGEEISSEDFQNRYNLWRTDKLGAFNTPGSLFSSDNTTVQTLLDRMSSGDYKPADVKELGEALGFAKNWERNDAVAKYGAASKEVQDLDFAAAAKTSGATLLDSVKKYIEDAKKFLGSNRPGFNIPGEEIGTFLDVDYVAQAKNQQRSFIYQRMGLDSGGINAADPTVARTDAELEIAKVTSEYRGFQKALEETGLTAEEAAAAISRGIDVRTAEIKAIEAEKNTRITAGLDQREVAAKLAAHMAGGNNQYSLANSVREERQRQEIYDAEKAVEAGTMSKANLERIKYIQGLEDEADRLSQIEDMNRVRDGQRTREMQAQFVVRGGPGFDRYNAQREEQISRHRQELFDAEQHGYTAAQIAGLKYVQGLEEQALTLQQNEDIARIHDGQRAREFQARITLRTPGFTQDIAEQEEQVARHRQELFDAQQQGFTAAQIAGLQYVQGLEDQALALQQAERALQKEEAYITRTAQAMVGLLAGSSAQQQGQYLVEDIQRQVAQAQELRNATSEADRARILEIQHIEDASVAVQRMAAAQQQYNEALKTAKGQIEGFRNSVKQWLDQQQVNQVGGPTAMASYLAAQQQYNDQLDKVRSGDTTAMGSITGYADRLIAAMQALDQPSAVANLAASKDAFDALVARAQAGDADAMSQVLSQADQYRQIGLNAYGSTEQYQTLLAQIQQTMRDLPDQISPEEMARKAIEKLNEDLVPPTKEQLEVIRSLERLSTATKAAVGLSNGTLDSTRTAITLLQQDQLAEARTGNNLADLILKELRKTPTPTTPTTPVPTGPTPAQQAYYDLVGLAGNVQSIGASWRASGMSEADIANAIEAQYGGLRDSLLRQMTPDLINRFGQAFWMGTHGPGVDLARQLIQQMGGIPQFAFGGMALSLKGSGAAFPALLHHGERVLTNEQNSIFERLSGAVLETPRWSMPTTSQRAANDHIVTREMLAEIREQKQQGEKVVTLLAELVTKLAGGDADEATLEDVVDAINRLQPALRGGQALAGARPISKAG